MDKDQRHLLRIAHAHAWQNCAADPVGVAIEVFADHYAIHLDREAAMDAIFIPKRTSGRWKRENPERMRKWRTAQR